MNERTLLVLAAVGASVVAHTVYALLSRDAGPANDTVAQVVDTEAEVLPAPREQRIPSERARRSRVNPVVRAEPNVAKRPPPPPPKPKLSIEEAREEYDALVTELERELQRNKETGKVLPNEDWVEYYRRGHEIMDPLRMQLGTGSEAERREVGEMDEALRELMSAVQLDPAKLDADG